jgi:hypothetical protein
MDDHLCHKIPIYDVFDKFGITLTLPIGVFAKFLLKKRFFAFPRIIFDQSLISGLF